MREIIPKELRLHRYLTSDEIVLIKQLRDKGNSFRGIARILGTSKTVVRYHCDPEVKKRMMIANRKNITKEQEKAANRRARDRVKQICGVAYTTIVYRENEPKINKLHEHNGLKLTLKGWSKHLNIPYSTLYARLWRGQKLFKD